MAFQNINPSLNTVQCNKHAKIYLILHAFPEIFTTTKTLIRKCCLQEKTKYILCQTTRKIVHPRQWQWLHSENNIDSRWYQNRWRSYYSKQTSLWWKNTRYAHSIYRISSYKALPGTIPAFIIVPAPGTLLWKWNLVISNGTCSWRPCKKIISVSLIWENKLR